MPAVAELYEEFGQALTALRANAAILLRRAGGQPDLQAAARDVETQSAAIDRRLRALLHALPSEPGSGTPSVAACLHARCKSWQDGGGRIFPVEIHVMPPALRVPHVLADALCQMTHQALVLAAGGGADAHLVVSVDADDAPHAGLRWTAAGADGLRLTAHLPLVGDGS